MADLTFTPYYCFVEHLAEKVHNLGSDTLKVCLSNTSPTLTHTQLSQVTQITNGNGYTTGGVSVTVSTSSQTTGTYTLVGSGTVSWTAVDDAMATFRYLVLYNDTATNKELIGYYDRGSTVTLAVGDSYVGNVAATLLTIAPSA